MIKNRTYLFLNIPLFTLYGFCILSNTVTTAYATTADAATATSTKYLQNKIQIEKDKLPVLKARIDPRLGITRTLRRHTSGDDVKILQQFLKAYGVYPDGEITGYFGPRTERAVKELQAKESLDTVGIIGPKTRTFILGFSKEKSKKNTSASSTAEILTATLTSSISENGATGASIPELAFASTTPDIYAVLTLKNIKQDTQISYIRTHENQYVDSQVSHASRNDLKYFHFQWSLKPGSLRAVGKYTISLYCNGKKAKEIMFSIY